LATSNPQAIAKRAVCQGEIDISIAFVLSGIAVFVSSIERLATTRCLSKLGRNVHLNGIAALEWRDDQSVGGGLGLAGE
jgi:hypothetical protein